MFINVEIYVVLIGVKNNFVNFFERKKFLEKGSNCYDIIEFDFLF